MEFAELFGAVFVVLAMWAIFAGSGWYIAKAMGRNPIEGLILGLLFGPIGLLIETGIGLYSAINAPPPPPDQVRVTLSPRSSATDLRRR